MKMALIAAAALLSLPMAAMAQTETAAGGAAASRNGPAESVLTEAQVMQYFAAMICDKNPYVEQQNKTTGETTGPMMLQAGDTPQVLADNYGKSWTVGGKTYFIRRVVAQPYEFATYRDGKFIGTRQENVLILYAGSDGGG